MRDYAKVAPTIWTGKTGQALKRAGQEAVIVGLYLMTSPHANMIGVYHCPIGYIAIDTGLSIEGASKGLQSAIEAGFCTFDAELGIVFVHEFAAYQVGDQLEPSDKRCAGVRNELNKVPKGHCRQAFVARYAASYHLPVEAENASPLQAPCKPLASQEQAKKQEQEQAQKQDALPADPPPAPPPAPPVPPPPTAATAAAPRGTRLPVDWVLPKPWGEWAIAEFPHWTADIVRRLAQQFKDHWTAKTKDATKLDWLATWRNWCSGDIAQRQFPPPKPVARKTDSLMAGNIAAAQRYLEGAHEA